MTINHTKLNSEIDNIKNYSPKSDAEKFFIQEVLRFHSISNTLLRIDIDLTKSCSVDERYFSHTLIRTLLENFFVIMYIFDDNNYINDRYDELKSSFKSDYQKLMTSLAVEPWVTTLNNNSLQFEPADPSWKSQKGLPNVHDILTKITNSQGDELNYLYVTYRVSSFDTHGRSLNALFNSVFQKQCNFPVLNIEYAFELIASEYLSTLQTIGAII